MRQRSIRRTAEAGVAVLALAATLGLSACGSSNDDSGGSATASGSAPATPKLTKVTQASFKTMSASPVYVAEERGLFKQHGIDMKVQETTSGKLNVAALLSGGAQVTALGVSDILNLRSQGKDVRFFYNMELPLTMDFVMSNKAMKKTGITPSSPIAAKLKALGGLNIGTTAPGAPTDLYPRYYLKQAGLDPQTGAKFVPIGDAATLVGALKSGRIDGFMLSPPTPYQAQQQGMGKVVISGHESLPAFKQFDFTTFATTAAYAKAHPEVLKGYTAAVSEATQWMIANPDAALQLLHKTAFSDTDLPTLKLSFDLFLKTVNPTGQVTSQALTNQLNVLTQVGAIKDKSTTPVSDLYVQPDGSPAQ